jgi:hypothetical protein
MECVQSRIGRSNVKLKRVTEKGWSFVHKAAPSNVGRGGIEHTHFAHWVYTVAVRNGCQKCTLEPQVPDSSHFGDVAYEKEGRLTIVQIVVNCDSNITSHVRAAFLESHAVDTLLFITPVKSEWDGIRAKVMADPELVFCIAKIQFDVMETYMKALWP